MGGSKPKEFIIDSGSQVNAIPDEDMPGLQKQIDAGRMIISRINKNVGMKLTAYAASAPLVVTKTFTAWVTTSDFDKPVVEAEFFVIKGATKSLLSRTTAEDLKVLAMGKDVNAIEFPDEFPVMPGVKVDFKVNKKIKPVNNGYVNIPLHFRADARRKVRDLVRQGIVSRFRGYAKWLSGVSVVPKGKNDCRLVVNMRAPNTAIMRSNHPMPRPEDMRAMLVGATVFSKLDLTSAFHHIELTERSKELTTFLMPDGMYQFNRLCFGVNCAPEIFQANMERIVAGIKGVIVYIDDILIFGPSLEELRASTKEVLKALRDNNLTLNEAKCEYEKQELTFLGFKVTPAGLMIDPAKIEAVLKFRHPENRTELKSFLGLANFMREFIKGFSDLTKPLRDADTDEAFEWGEQQDVAFEAVKKAIAECTTTLGYFDVNDKTILYTDASPYAVGAVLCQRNKEGVERVISFASKALAISEKNYPQIQREGLGVVWGAEHFYFYLLGTRFILRTDADGIRYIFDRSQDAKKPKRYLRRSEGWAMRLEIFDYEIEHIAGELNIADVPSRLVNETEEATQYVEGVWPGEIMQIESQLPPMVKFPKDSLAVQEIKETADKCEEIQKVIQALESGVWPKEIRAFELVRDQLFMMNGVLTNLGLIVMPRGLREKALSIAHSGHLGMTKTKSILRERVWWPRMGRAVAAWVKSCQTCRLNGAQTRPVPMRRSLLPSGPWSELAIDYSGPYKRHNDELVVAVVDCYTRYVSTCIVPSTAWEHLEPFLKHLFNRFGYPDKVRSDNGAPMSGKEYAEFLRQKGIEFDFSFPLDPQQNGMAESTMKHIQAAARAVSAEGGSFEEALQLRVQAHNSAQHTVTGATPNELMFNRKLRFGLPLMRPAVPDTNHEQVEVRDYLSKAKGKEKEDRKRRARPAEIEVGDTVVQLRSKSLKGDTVYDPEELTVTDINHGDVTMKDSSGSQVRRSIKKVKLMKKGDGTWAVRDTPRKKTRASPVNDQLSPRENSPVPTTSRFGRNAGAPKRFNDYEQWSSEDDY